ncbi:MAG: hypothetical protein IJR90_03310 [Clostridia bacterium]|nr:hypothetical protein [Clostridia bacterium]
MAKNKDYTHETEEDDGRVIADMSGVEPAAPSLFGFRSLMRSSRKNDPDDPELEARRRQAAEMSGKDTFRYILGAVGAGLLIAGVFIAVFGLFIWLLCTVW